MPKSLKEYLGLEEFDPSAIEQQEAEAAAAAQVEAEEAEINAPVAEDVVEEAELEIPAIPEEEIAEEEVMEAEEVVDEAVEEDAELDEEVDGAEVVTDEIVEDVESVEHFITVLQHGIKTKTYSPQFAATAARELGRLGEKFGAKAPGIPSLESYGHDSLEGYYEASLESFGGFIKRLDNAFGNIIMYIPDLVKSGRMVTGFKKRAAALNTSIDAALQAAGALDNKAVATGVSAGKSLGVQGAGLLEGIDYDLRLTSAVVTKGLAANAALVGGAVKILDEANTQGGKGKTGGIVAKAAQLPAATDAFPAEAYTKGFAGGTVFKRAEVGGEDTRGKLKSLAKGGIPEVGKGKAAKPEAADLNKAAIVKLLKTAKVFAQLGVAAADKTGVEALEQAKQAQGGQMRSQVSSVYGGAERTTWGEGKDLDALATALPKLVSRHVKVYRFTADHALRMAADLQSLAQVAIKRAKAPAAAE